MTDEVCIIYITPVDGFKPGMPQSHVSCKAVDVDTGDTYVTLRRSQLFLIIL